MTEFFASSYPTILFHRFLFMNVHIISVLVRVRGISLNYMYDILPSLSKSQRRIEPSNIHINRPFLLNLSVSGVPTT